MTEPVVCHKGKCSYKDTQSLDECLDCDIVEQIEHDLLSKDLKGFRR
jgi:hypothetical protein